jgi:hypothetical protein
MSPEAIAARLKLASELRDLCLLLGTAKIETKPETFKTKPPTKREQAPKKLRSPQEKPK